MDSLCRTCVKSFDIALDSIFLGSRFQLKFADMIKECTSIEVTEEDQLPKQICVDCQIKLEASYSFKKQCLESAEMLQEILKTNDAIVAIEIKDEQIAIDILDENSSDHGESIINDYVGLIKCAGCDQCPMQFSDQQLLAEHLLKSHSDDTASAAKYNSADDPEETTIHEYEDPINLAECDQCPMQFSNEQLLAEHVLKSHSDATASAAKYNSADDPEETTILEYEDPINLAECDQCPMQFSNEQLLAEHLLKSHTDDTALAAKCNICEKAFHLKRSLTRHLITAHNTIFKDNTRGLDTFGISSSKKARKTTFPNNLAPIECMRCCKPCKDTKLLTEHVKSHVDYSKPFGCYICQKEFYQKRDLRAHIRRLHPARNTSDLRRVRKKMIDNSMIVFEDNNKDFAFTSRPNKADKTNLSDDLEPVECYRCYKPFNDEQLYTEHLKSHDGDSTPFVCFLCGTGFSHRRSLKSHIVKFHPTENTSDLRRLNKKEIDNSSKNVFEDNNKDLEIFAFTLRPNEADKTNLSEDFEPVECNHCYKPFNDEQLYTEHLKSHDGDSTPYVCYLCGTGYLHRRSLKSHIVRIHSTENTSDLRRVDKKEIDNSSKNVLEDNNEDLEIFAFTSRPNEADKTNLSDDFEPVECNRCYKPFNDEQLYTEHLKTHDGDSTPFICYLCGLGYLHRRNLKAHIVRFHPIQNTTEIVDQNAGWRRVNLNNFANDEQLCTELLKTHDGDSSARCKRVKYKKIGNSSSNVFEDGKEDLDQVIPKSNPIDGHKNKLTNNLAPVECNRCYKRLKDEELLAEHLKSHNNDLKPFTCYLCRSDFQHRRSLKAHIIKFHPTSHNFEMNESIECLENLNQKELEISSSNVIVDNEDLDNFAVTSSSNENDKTNLFDNLAQPQCNICLEHFYNEELLAIHVKTHDERDLSPVVCHICGKTIKHKRSLKKHLRMHDRKKLESSTRTKPTNINYWNSTVSVKRKKKDRFECNECTVVFHGLQSYKRHLAEEHPSVLNKCEYCDKLFLTIGNLNGHTRKYHKMPDYFYQLLTSTEGEENRQIPKALENQQSNQPYNECRRCCKPFENQELLDEHMKSHADDLTPFECYICGQGIANKGALTRHMSLGRHFLEKGQDNDSIPSTEDINKLQHICDICGKCFSNRYRLMSHRRTHFTIRTRNIVFMADAAKRVLKRKDDPSKKLLVIETFKCFICQEIFANSRLLHKHLKSVHNHDRFWCEQCNTFYESKDLLEEHITKIDNLTCKRCLLRCDNVDAFTEHVQTHDNDPRPYKCRICGKGIKYASTLVQHSLIHTGERPNMCQWCGRSFTNNAYLKDHLWRKHTDRDIRPFSCKICNKSFREKQALIRHGPVHESTRPFNCEKCGVSFKRKNTLRYHLKVHLGLIEKNPCHLCGKLIIKQHMSKHMLCHTGEKKHVCVVCDRPFRRPEHLKVHMKTHAG